MVNITSLTSNKTQVLYNGWTAESLRTIYMAVIFPPFCFYLLCVIVILCTFFTTSHIRENVRYLLFSHMLVSNSLQLTLAFILFVLVLYLTYIPVTWCLFLCGLSVTTTLITPVNLAFMSLERYIAVCFPLRHGEICTVCRCKVAIGVMWGIGAFPVLTEIVILCYFSDKTFFSLKMVCIWKYLQKFNFQITIRYLSFSLSFGVVLIIILYTYVRVMLVARKIGSKNSSAFKATKTLLLHAFQLFLCLCSYSSIYTETLFKNQYYLFLAPLNFFIFICLPQYISPLIYGIRDVAIRKCIRKLLCST